MVLEIGSKCIFLTATFNVSGHIHSHLDYSVIARILKYISYREFYLYIVLKELLTH